MATFSTPVPPPVKNDWLQATENVRLSPTSPGGPRKAAPQSSIGSQGVGARQLPPPPAGTHQAPSIPNRPGGAAPPVPGGRPASGALPAPLIPS